jgi:hypothetical protein
LLLGTPLRGDPAPHVFGAVDEPNPGGFRLREKAHRVPIDEGDVTEIEGDATDRFVRKELLQPGYMVDVYISTQSEYDRVRRCRPMDSVGQPRAPMLAQVSKRQAKPK